MPSRDQLYNSDPLYTCVINRSQHIYVLEALTLAVIVLSYVVINDRKKKAKYVDGGLRNCYYADLA